MFQAQNKETINSSWKVAVCFKIIMMTSVTRPCFTTQHQLCKSKTKTTMCKIKTDISLVWDRRSQTTSLETVGYWVSRRTRKYHLLLTMKLYWLRMKLSKKLRKSLQRRGIFIQRVHVGELGDRCLFWITCRQFACRHYWATRAVCRVQCISLNLPLRLAAVGCSLQ